MARISDKDDGEVLLLENMRGESLGERFGTEDPAVESLSGGVGGAAARL